MTYDLSPSLFLENGRVGLPPAVQGHAGGMTDPAIPAKQAAATLSANRAAHDYARLWRTYDREHRLALIENQLRAA